MIPDATTTADHAQQLRAGAPQGSPPDSLLVPPLPRLPQELPAVEQVAEPYEAPAPPAEYHTDPRVDGLRVVIRACGWDRDDFRVVVEAPVVGGQRSYAALIAKLEAPEARSLAQNYAQRNGIPYAGIHKTISPYPVDGNGQVISSGIPAAYRIDVLTRRTSIQV